MQLALASADSPGFVGGGGRTNSVPPVVGYTYKYKYALINISIRVDISDSCVAGHRQFCGRDENIYQVGWQCVLELFI